MKIIWLCQKCDESNEVTLDNDHVMYDSEEIMWTTSCSKCGALHLITLSGDIDSEEIIVKKRHQMPKIRPILFKGEMVRDILRGDKAQTRRPMRVQPVGGLQNGLVLDIVNGKKEWVNSHGAVIKCPFGYPGDQLYVRETWRLQTGSDYEHTSIVVYEDGSKKAIHWMDGYEIGKKYGLSLKPDKRRPSIHMPKWASRITLNVIDVRAERVQDITEEDAIAEGIVEDDNCTVAVENYGNGPVEIGGTRYFNGVTDEGHESAGDSFTDLWDSIYAKPKPVKVGGKIVRYESFPFSEFSELRDRRKIINGSPHVCYPNPWVWVCEFSVAGK